MKKVPRRLRLAERVCRELRYQLSSSGRIYDINLIADYLIAWIPRAGKDKNERPKFRKR